MEHKSPQTSLQPSRADSPATRAEDVTPVRTTAARQAASPENTAHASGVRQVAGRGAACEPKAKRLARLKEKQAALEWRIKRMEAVEKTEAKKRETRKKIVIGGYFLARMAKDPSLEKNVLTKLERTLTRRVDRELFGFDTEGRSK